MRIYNSFLIRCWLTRKGTKEARTTYEIEHIQTGERLRAHELPDLHDWIRTASQTRRPGPGVKEVETEEGSEIVMRSYVFIEARDPFESRDSFVTQTASELKERGNDVTVFLVQNGVLAARAAAGISPLPALIQAGIQVVADDFSLRERGIRREELNPGITTADIDALVDLLVRDNTKAIWH